MKSKPRIMTVGLLLAFALLATAPATLAQCTACKRPNHGKSVEPKEGDVSAAVGKCPWYLVEIRSPKAISVPGSSTTSGDDKATASSGNRHASASGRSGSTTVTSSSGYSFSSNWKFYDAISTCSCNSWTSIIAVQMTAEGEYIANGSSTGSGTASIGGAITVVNTDPRVQSGGPQTVAFGGSANVTTATSQTGSFNFGLQIGGIGFNFGGGGFPVTLGSLPITRPLTQQTGASGGGGSSTVLTSSNASSSLSMTGSGDPKNPAGMGVGISDFKITLVFTGNCSVCQTTVEETTIIGD